MKTRPVPIPSGDLTLEGELYLPEGGAENMVVLCHPHPQYGGDMHNNVVQSAARGLVAAGTGALAFNFRGVGASSGSYDNGVGERDDVRAAAAFARALEGTRRVGLLGYSFGAVMAAQVAEEPLAGLALVSLPVRMLDAGGDVALTRFEKPVLIVVGDRDQVSPAAFVREFAEALPGDVRLELVTGADHFWYGFEDRLIELVVRFFERCFSGQEEVP